MRWIRHSAKLPEAPAYHLGGALPVRARQQGTCRRPAGMAMGLLLSAAASSSAAVFEHGLFNVAVARWSESPTHRWAALKSIVPGAAGLPAACTEYLLPAAASVAMARIILGSRRCA